LLKEFQTEKPAATGERVPALEQGQSPRVLDPEPFHPYEFLSLFIMLINLHSIIWFAWMLVIHTRSFLIRF
jgi:hypothetical protein